jgi:hypothetical protein
VRKFICFFLACSFLVTNKVNANEDESFYIKRAYLDTIEKIPTIEEIEWYLVYNTEGYKLAVDWLVQNKDYKWNIPKEYAKILLLSKDYHNLPKMLLDKLQVRKNLLYVVGMDQEPTIENVEIAKLSLIKMAIECGGTETEIMDYMANSLMCRSTNLEENNILSKIIKESRKNENDTWLDVLNAILEFEDVKTK